MVNVHSQPLCASNPFPHPHLPRSLSSSVDTEDRLTYEELLRAFSRFDFRRLESYSRNLVDYHVILDMLPTLARYFFLRRFPFQLTYTQAAILLSLGLQYKSVTEVEVCVPLLLACSANQKKTLSEWGDEPLFVAFIH